MFNKKIKNELKQIKEDYLSLKREFDVFRFKSFYPQGYDVKIDRYRDQNIAPLVIGNICLEYAYNNIYANKVELKKVEFRPILHEHIYKCSVDVVKETYCGFILIYKYINHLNKVCKEVYEIEKKTGIVLNITKDLSAYLDLSI